MDAASPGPKLALAGGAASNPASRSFSAGIHGTTGRRPLRLLCYGDSNTAGYCDGGHDFQPYADFLVQALAASGMPCAARACGVSGRSAKEMQEGLHQAVLPDKMGNSGRGLARLLAEEEEENGQVPDLAIIMTGTNDLGRHHQPEEIVRAVASLHRACHDRGVPTLVLLPTASTLPSMREDRNRLTKLLLPWARATAGVVDCLDVEELLGGKPSCGQASLVWEADDLHLSPAGSRMLGQLLATRISKDLGKLSNWRAKHNGAASGAPRSNSSMPCSFRWPDVLATSARVPNPPPFGVHRQPPVVAAH